MVTVAPKELKNIDMWKIFLCVLKTFTQNLKKIVLEVVIHAEKKKNCFYQSFPIFLSPIPTKSINIYNWQSEDKKVCRCGITEIKT
jgi:hypothetical protein